MVYYYILGIFIIRGSGSSLLGGGDYRVLGLELDGLKPVKATPGLGFRVSGFGFKSFPRLCTSPSPKGLNPVKAEPETQKS